MILGIGMAVDANVLVFERIRDELRAGRTAYGSMESGFSKAIVTILDTHVTTVGGGDPIPLRDGADPRLRRHAYHRVVGQPLHGRLRLAIDVPVAVESRRTESGDHQRLITAIKECEQI